MSNETKQRSSFGVGLEPEFDKDGNWEGNITAYVEETVGDDLDEEQVNHIRVVCGMLASCLQLFEKDEDFLNYVKDYFFGSYQEELEALLNEEEDAKNPVFTRSKDGKVITLDFNTKTHGSA